MYAKPEPSSTNRTRYYVESTDAHPLPIIKLGTSTAHIYCLRIMKCAAAHFIYIHLSGRDLANKLARGMAEIHARRVATMSEVLA